MPKLSTCLWFDDQAEEAARFYVSVFKNSKITATTYYPEGVPMPKPAGSVLTVQFTIEGEEFMALNGGPEYKFTPAISIVVNCDSQEEVDELWRRLSDGGQEVQCGWLTDRYGVSWQVVPREFVEMLTRPDKAAVRRVIAAMMPMKKLDLAVLRKAYAGN
jgi:predicted 3-demethylubiquinone-9 3-methyltransferase (glyoxalase superfamily)